MTTTTAARKIAGAAPPPSSEGDGAAPPETRPATSWCPDCMRLAPVRGDGAFAWHQDRGGRRCLLVGKQRPDWLRTLTDGGPVNALATVWTTDQAAAHLGASRSHTHKLLGDAGIHPVIRSGRGGRRLWDPLDVHELRVRRDQERPRPGGRRRATVAAADIDELRALYARARRVNGSTPVDSPDRVASRDLATRLVALHRAGAPFPLLDEALGCRPGTTRRRAVRHQLHGAVPPSVAPYRGITTPKTGHPAVDLTGRRVRFITVLARTDRRARRKADGWLWHCRCICGREFLASAMQLLESPARLPIRSCGCRASGRRPTVEFLEPPEVEAGR